METPTDAEREAQRAYWREHSAEATVEAMMLDSQAAAIDNLERPEVMRLLGPVDALRVVELGAGIGRFTGPLARGAKSMLAVDFMQNLIDENAAANGHLGNVTFRCGDATELRLPPTSVDVVFSNWLLMYLSDEEVAALAGRMLRWLADGGIVFFRESCFRQSGDRKRGANPTHYRNPREYFRIFDGVAEAQEGGGVAHLELVCCKSVDTYVRVKRNQNQVCWKWRRVVSRTAAANDQRHFLDGGQYTPAGIERYQRMYGRGFVSPGGLETTKEFAAMLGLRPDDNVLDVGCGVGGSAVYMARTYGCYVYGIDLSVNMILAALDSAAAQGNGDKVSFEVSDAARRDLPAESYDAVYSRDTLVHIADKRALFARLYAVLKPGGRLLITDYCRGEGPMSAAFETYVAQRAYDMRTVDDYAAALREAGFAGVLAEDWSGRLRQCLEAELAAVLLDSEGFVAEFGRAAYDEAVASWRGKLERCVAGEHRWGLFRAVKPS